MQSEIAQLNEVYHDLTSGKTATPVTIRNFLHWFGVQRRTVLNVEYINQELAKCDLQTVPNYLNIWVDTPITFELMSQKGKRVEEKFIDQESVTSEGENPQVDAAQESIVLPDPSFRAGKLKAASRPPIFVKPNDPISKAMTIMMARNFSQIPVMTTERDVKGVVSWASIGERYAIGITGTDAQHFMNDHQEITIATSLFAAIKIIAEHNYVLVRDGANKISGIITANDIAFQFEDTSTPFLLLSEIENHLRVLIGKSVSVEDIKTTCNEQYLPKDFSKISDLTFGNYVHILDHPDNWSKVGLRLDKAAFIADIKETNKIRNDVMHFDPDPIENDHLTKLRDMARLLDTLRRIAK